MHQDYILRMIQQIGIFITRILRLREDGDFDEALTVLDRAYGRLAGLPGSLIHAISEDDLVNLMSAQGPVATERFLALGELLREEGLTYEAQGAESEALPRYVKSLRMYLEVIRTDSDLSQTELPGLDDVIRRVSGQPLNASTRELLLPYLEQSGQYDQMENVLTAWLEVDPTGAACADTESFYRRLQALPDGALIVGGLTRGEVQEGIASLQLLC
ncbi:DUF6483 family protein [soil metagenome]